jgi:hypothetical protein
MPVTQNGSYGVPVMARRDLHGDSRAYGSTSFSSTNSILSTPAKLISNVRSQLVNSYSAIRDRLTHHSTQQAPPPPFLNSPSTHGAARVTRTSSQSSTSGQATNYNLRRRPPVHSTPRDIDTEDRKTTSKQRKSQDSKEESEESSDEKHEKKETHDENKDNIIVRLLKRIIHLPIDIFSFIWHKLFGLPWWLLLPLLIFLGFYVCKSPLVFILNFHLFFNSS